MTDNATAPTGAPGAGELGAADPTTDPTPDPAGAEERPGPVGGWFTIGTDGPSPVPPALAGVLPPDGTPIGTVQADAELVIRALGLPPVAVASIACDLGSIVTATGPDGGRTVEVRSLDEASLYRQLAGTMRGLIPELEKQADDLDKAREEDEAAGAEGGGCAAAAAAADQHAG